MDRNLYYVGIAFFGMVNGLFNPLMPLAYVFSKVLMFVPLFGSESLIFYFASLMLSTATIILGGIRLRSTSGSSAPRTTRPRSQCGSGWQEPRS